MPVERDTQGAPALPDHAYLYKLAEHRTPNLALPLPSLTYNKLVVCSAASAYQTTTAGYLVRRTYVKMIEEIHIESFPNISCPNP